MKRTLSYFFLNIFFTLLFVLSYEATTVFIVGKFDPKFGEIGTLYFALFVSGLCSIVTSFSSTAIFSIFSKTKLRHLSLIELTRHTSLNGAIIAILYMPVFKYMPIINGIKDWPQYILYFLLLGIASAFVSTNMCNRLKNPATMLMSRQQGQNDNA